MRRFLLGGALLVFSGALLFVACKPKPSANCKAIGGSCTQTTDCCSWTCTSPDAGVCACQPEDGGVCATTADCCSGLVCLNNECLGGVKADGGLCSVVDAGCASGSDCCAAEKCNLGALADGGGQCASCQPIGQTCNRNPDCCFNACGPAGLCQCVDKGQRCDDGTSCCSGTCLPADAGAGANTCACVALGGPCVGGGSCCAQAGVQCKANPDGGTMSGLTTICCLGKNTACTTGGDCCSGICNGTKCQ